MPQRNNAFPLTALLLFVMLPAGVACSDLSPDSDDLKAEEEDTIGPLPKIKRPPAVLKRTTSKQSSFKDLLVLGIKNSNRLTKSLSDREERAQISGLNTSNYWDCICSHCPLDMCYWCWNYDKYHPKHPKQQKGRCTMTPQERHDCQSQCWYGCCGLGFLLGACCCTCSCIVVECCCCGRVPPLFYADKSFDAD